MRCPCDVLVLDPAVDPLNEETKEKAAITNKKRSGRGHHHLPKLKEVLKRSDTWLKLTDKDQYEFPGFETDPQSSQKPLAYVEDWRKLPFAASSRPHFMTNQLSTNYQ